METRIKALIESVKKEVKQDTLVYKDLQNKIALQQLFLLQLEDLLKKDEV